MNDQLQQEVITIASAEFTNWGLKVKDQKGLIFNISQFKKDTQEETVAYKTITSLPKNGLGMTKLFKFAVVPNSQGGQSRYVRIIEDADVISAHTAPQSGYNQRPAQRPQHTENGFGKCKFGFLIELLKLGKNLIEAEAIAEAWAEASMRKLPQQTKPAQVAHQDYEQPDFPEEDQDVQIQNIPF